MNNFTRFYASLFLVGAFFFLWPKILFAQNLLPSEENIGHGEGGQLITYFPSITFGQLLDGSYQTIIEEKQKQKELAETAKIKDLLARLEQAYNDSINNNQIINQPTPEQSITNDNQIADNTQHFDAAQGKPTTYNLQLTTIIPTPSMSQSTLMANINDYINNISQTTDTETNPTSPSQTWLRGASNSQLNSSLGEPKKSWFSIALLGDSMTDTLQTDLPQLSAKLKEAYPDYTFRLYNYGQGATDLESGLFRLTNTTNYLGKEFPPLLSYHPDILVIESFAYNPWSWEMYDLDRQWLTIARIIDVVKTNSPQTKIILASTIAPNTKIFGDGALNWDAEGKWKKATTIKLYLQNMVNFATSQNYPLADAYHASMDNSGEGLEQYINGGDHLHPSGEGGILYAQKIVETIKKYEMVK